jgi:hypothetical protein
MSHDLTICRVMSVDRYYYHYLPVQASDLLWMYYISTPWPLQQDHCPQDRSFNLHCCPLSCSMVSETWKGWVFWRFTYTNKWLMFQYSSDTTLVFVESMENKPEVEMYSLATNIGIHPWRKYGTAPTIQPIHKIGLSSTSGWSWLFV